MDDNRKSVDEAELVYYRSGGSQKDAFTAGYAACAEKMRAEIEQVKFDDTKTEAARVYVSALLKAERERSARLIARLRLTRTLDSSSKVQSVIEQAIAEWEASRD